MYLSTLPAPFFAWCVLVAAIVVCARYRKTIHRSLHRQTQSTQHAKPVSPAKEKLEHRYSEEAYYAIDALPDLELDKEEPLKLRPFKPKFHMTMALENTTVSDLIPMDATYRSRIQLRAQLIAQERYEVLACNPKAVPAVLELYAWLTNTYLPLRFPTIFTLTSPPSHLLNSVTNEILPLVLPPTNAGAENALEILARNVDNEFLVLLKSAKPEDEGKHRLEALINCFPSGFNTRSKLNMLLSDIHTPVPGYKAKLEKSMDRFFAALPVGKIVKRANWSISTDGELFCLAGNHMTEDEAELAAKENKEELEEQDFDLSKTFVRCERQTLHRLPKTGALVFAFRTYMYPLHEIRDQGSGEVLAEAIDGLGLGGVPGMTIYKRQVIWGEKIKAYLRGEIEA